MTEYRATLKRARGRFPAPELPVEAILRRRDRRRRNRRIGTAVLALALAAIAIGGAARAVRGAEIPRPARLPSTPDAWSRVPLEPAAVAQDIYVNAITPGGPGLVAGGFAGNLAAVWTSSDGRTWNPVNQGLSGGPILDVTTGGPGLVAVGTQGGQWWAGRGNEAPVWTSVDGLAWSEAPPDPVFRGAWMRAVAAGGPGLVAVGSTLDGPQAWHSSDGVTWERASVPPAPPDIAYEDHQADAWMRDVAAAGDRLVAVGQIGLEVRLQAGEKGVRYVPVIWTSTDGVTWTKVPLDEDVFPTWSETRSIAAGPGGFVAVGGIDRGKPMVWKSEDGLNWQRVSAGQDAFVSRASGQSEDSDLYFLVHSVAAGSGGYVAMGGDVWCHYGGHWLCSPAEAAVWTSTDGETWVRVPTGPELQVGGRTRVEISAVTAWGSRFVAAGRYSEPTPGGRAPRIAIWISEPPEAERLSPGPSR